MNLPKFGRTKLIKGVSLLAIVAMVGIGYSGFGSMPDAEFNMSSKTADELEALSDPLFEELFEDKYHRQLEAYKASKGWFSCDDVCETNKHRVLLVSRELNSIQAERQAARLAALQLAREQRLSDMQARQAANLARREMSHMTPEDRISVRRLARKAERDAERAIAITAYRAELGIGDPLTLEQKQARAAAAKQARIDARLSRKTPVDAAADAKARQDDRYLEYLNEVAHAHGFHSWVHVEHFLDLTPEERAALRDPDQPDGTLQARHNIRAAARHAQSRTPAPTTSPTPAPTPAPTTSPTTPAPTPCSYDPNASTGDLRISGGGHTGRLEIFYNEMWGTVCDDSFHTADANVACRQLGFNSGTSYTFGNPASASCLPINVDDVQCNGNENTLLECTARWGSHNCGHHEDTGLICSNDSPP